MRKLIIFLCLLFLVSPAWAQFNIQPAPIPFKYAYLQYTSTVLVKSGRGYLHNLTMEGGTAGFVTIYDWGQQAGLSASGVVVGYASGPIIGNFDATSALFTYTYDVGFSSGCTVVTTAPTKITISYM